MDCQFFAKNTIKMLETGDYISTFESSIFTSYSLFTVMYKPQGITGNGIIPK